MAYSRATRRAAPMSGLSPQRLDQLGGRVYRKHGRREVVCASRHDAFGSRLTGRLVEYGTFKVTKPAVQRSLQRTPVYRSNPEQIKQPLNACSHLHVILLFASNVVNRRDGGSCQKPL